MNKIFQGDSLKVLKTLPDQCVQTCVTSPPYFGLRDYGMKGQMGLEETPEAYVEKMVELFREVRRVLRDDGTLWLNLGDSYAGSGRGRDADGTWNPGKGGSKQSTNQGAIIGRKVNSLSLSRNLIRKGALGNKWVKPPLGFKAKDLIGIPWRVAFALQADGWYLRQDIIWSKPNPMPESVTDRCTKAHEYIFLLSKSPRYYFDHEAIKVPVKQDWGTRDRSKGKYTSAKNATGLQPHGGLEKVYTMANKRSVWSVTTKPFKGAHFATFPTTLIEPCVLAGAPNGGVVLDPFFGSGTTGAVALQHGRQYLGIELNPAYIKLARERLAGVQLPLAA